MTVIHERQAQLATIRRRPISAALKAVLQGAGEAAGIDEIVITSGGQAPAGQGPHTGSDRHDDGKAADLDLYKGGRLLSFEDGDRTIVALFLSECARRGATGIGAGVGYMGPSRMHVGFGSRSIWGAGGKAANAPGWLIEAVQKGWANPIAATPTLRKGDKGPDVLRLQKALWAEGFDCGPPDSDFGAKTERAVIAFQQARGLAADGVVGARTWAALKVAG